MPNPIIKMDNVSKSYSQGESLIPVIKNIDISISDSEFTSVIGPSGSGKSTLLNIIGLIDTADSGEIFFFNENLKDISMASPNEVKTCTGYTIGGVSPVGHLTKIEIFVDSGLERFNSIFAAAGHPNCVFEIKFNKLVQITNGKIENITE